MGITFLTKVTITDSFRDLIKAHRYEDYVYKIISGSETIFKCKSFIHVQDQSDGESDFVDQDGVKYEAKLIS